METKAPPWLGDAKHLSNVINTTIGKFRRRTGVKKGPGGEPGQELG